MRISDWSSDVCSSDLALRRLNTRADSGSALDEPDAEFLAALRDDLNTPLAIKRLHDMHAENLKASLAHLGFAGKQADEALSPTPQALLDERAQARANKDWGRSDTLRDELLGFGIAVRDSAGGTEWERVSVNQHARLRSANRGKKHTKKIGKA